MKALEIYKPPFWISEPYIFSSNGVMAFMILTRNNELIRNICDTLSNEDTHLNLGNITYANDVFIQKDNENILLLRGWGHLTGGGALNLPDKEAIQIQNEFRDWVISKLKGKK